ncbi:hypothetical protein [Tranquillimonas alkanivorans]|uniref:Chromosome partitioning protein, ParB family n=1 Tax=Tranquillimonas alkanivorans TaxID=441119 RepID=A0A1I5VYB0_9RHOB|nr:hypothetical protein [Tranquillimonas alkanivorans]SFQ12441.1 hypothetical protein SAMN04488047_13726 [Tranquillimonas alkanivorans]
MKNQVMRPKRPRESSPTEDAVPLSVSNKGVWGQASRAQTAHIVEELRSNTQRLSEAIRKGRVAVELDPSQIVDEVGSDRLGDWGNDKAFAELVENFKVRGQMQPIRVRPADPAWQPDESKPYAISENEKFILQSGRRRKAACEVLKRPVLAVITTELKDGDGTLSDLQERYFENQIRKNLTGIEFYLAVGEMAYYIRETHGSDISQRAIADRLKLPQPTVALGLKAQRFRVELEARLPAEASQRQVREILPLLEMELEGTESSDAAKRTISKGKSGHAQKCIPLEHGGDVRIKPTKSGITMIAKHVAIPEKQQAAFERDLAALLSRYQSG